jgi:hypothetical protein
MHLYFKVAVCAALMSVTIGACSRGDDEPGVSNGGGGAPAVAPEYPSISDMLATDDGPTVRVGPIGDAMAPAPPPAWVVGSSPFGVTCETDADCADGLTCLTEDSSDWLGGGAPSGYCSLDCKADPQICSTYDPLGVCLVASDTGNSYCFEGCFQGEPFEGETKCHDRQDLVCAAFGFSSACVPSCGTHEVCGERSCDIRRGVCTDESWEGMPIGTRCDRNYSPCEALCLDFGRDVLLCSGFCTYGQPGQCGNALDATPGGGDPLCIPMSSFAAKGDGGVCLQGCNCDSECASIGMRCKAWDDPEQAEDYGTNGLCYPEEFLDIPAPDAGSDAGTIGIPCSVPAPVSDAGTDAGD